MVSEKLSALGTTADDVAQSSVSVTTKRASILYTNIQLIFFLPIFLWATKSHDKYESALEMKEVRPRRGVYFHWTAFKCGYELIATFAPHL